MSRKRDGANSGTSRVTKLVAIRIPNELLAFIDGRVLAQKELGIDWDRSKEIISAVLAKKRRAEA